MRPAPRRLVLAARVATLMVFAVAAGLLYQRLRRTPEQRELANYVEHELPALLSAEHVIAERMERLGERSGLAPEAARTLLVDDLVPRLLKVRQQAETVDARTPAVYDLTRSYLRVLDRMLDACRACVRAIDDPKLPEARGWQEVRARFADAERQRSAFYAELDGTLKQHHLAGRSSR